MDVDGEGRDRGATDLRDVLALLRRRRGTIVVAVVVATASALGVSLLQDPVYEASARVLLETVRSQSLFDPGTGAYIDPSRVVDTQIEVLRSRPIAAAVREELGPVPPVSASPVGDTDMIRVTVRGSEPRLLAKAADAYARHYIRYRRQQSVGELLAAADEIATKIRQLDDQLDDLESEGDRIDATVEAEGQIGRRDVAPEREALIQQRSVFKLKLDQLQVDASLRGGGSQLVATAPIPVAPVAPRPLRSALLGFVLGIVAGVGLAVLRDHLDDSIKTKEELEAVAPGVPILAVIPNVSEWRESDRAYLVSVDEPRSAAAEAYRGLRTAVHFMRLDRPLRTIQVTSPGAGEGKSTTLANLAVSLANAGDNVSIVDCDLRRPRIHQFFDIPGEVGLTTVLLGHHGLDEALRPVGVPRVRVLPSGPPPHNPSEVLAGRSVLGVLTAIQAQSDVALFDSPPLLPVTDATILSRQMDATLVVVRAGHTTKKDLRQALEMLRQVDAPIAGIILNVTATGPGYGYAGSYYGASDASDGPGRDPVTAVTG